MGLLKWLKGKLLKAAVNDYESEYIDDEIRDLDQPLKRSSLNIRDDAQSHAADGIVVPGDLPVIHQGVNGDDARRG